MSKKVLDIEEASRIVSQVWMSVEDLGRITMMGRSRSYELKRMILDELESQNKRLISSSYLPTSAVIHFLDDPLLNSIYYNVSEKYKYVDVKQHNYN